MHFLASFNTSFAAILNTVHPFSQVLSVPLNLSQTNKQTNTSTMSTLIESTYEQLALQLTTLTTIFSTLENARETISAEPETPFQQEVLSSLQTQLDKASRSITSFSELLTQKINEPVDEQLDLKSWREVA